jgi:hypothetical protein
VVEIERENMLDELLVRVEELAPVREPPERGRVHDLGLDIDLWALGLVEVQTALHSRSGFPARTLGCEADKSSRCSSDMVRGHVSLGVVDWCSCGAVGRLQRLGRTRRAGIRFDSELCGGSESCGR